MTITVKVAVVPGTVTEVALEEGSTVADAIAAANVDTDGYSVKLNGVATANDQTLSDGARLFISKEAKGNA